MNLEQLTTYYKSRGIAATAFKCPHLKDCSSGATDFVEAREPLVGDQYELGILPRLLFISLDPATDMVGRSPQDRAALHVREWESRQARSANGGPEFKKTAHWYRTYELAHRILAPIARERGMSPLSFSQMWRYFAHTNSAKCKDTGVGTAQATARIFQNCQEFIPGEVAVLEPDIIVTQGKFARESVAGAFPVVAVGLAPNPSYRAEVVDVGGHLAIKFETHHPNRKDNSYRNEVAEAWKWYATVAAVFTRDGLPALMSEYGFSEA